MFILLLRAVALAAALLPLVAKAAPLSLELALNLAVQRSQAARAARTGLASAVESASAAGQLPDPVLRAGIDNLPVTGSDRLSETRDSMTMKRIGISQEWLSAQKRSARQAVAEAAVGRESVNARAAVAETRLQTALAYVEAFYAGEALKLAALMEHHAHEELEASRARLASSAASSQDVLASTGARGVAEDESAEARQLQSATHAVLQRWVGEEAGELALLALPSVPTESAYVAGQPAVAAMESDLQVARLAAAAAVSDRKANWTWEASYGQRTGYSDMVSLGVSIPLQVAPDQRQNREIASRLLLVDKAEAELAEAQRAATGEYRALASDIERLRERTERYRGGVVTPAGQRTSTATAAYRSNQGSLATVFEARHAEVEAQRKLLSLQRQLASAQAQLVFKPLTQGASQ
ncbi:MAG: putative outer rane efflux protein [Rhizobacter sp.]|nr:putative outer rane efflux protein [Rhizobacter sp.]